MRTTRPAALLGLALLTAAAGGLTAAPAAADPPTGPACAVQRLAVPPGAGGVYINATDPTGRYQVGDGTVRDAYRALVWDAGQVSDTGRDDLWLADVNAGGTAVGAVSGADGARAVRWQAGQVSPLPQPAGVLESRAVAINGHGEIAGHVSTEPNWWGQRPVVWSPGGQIRELTAPLGFNEVTVRGIDEDGTVLGVAQQIDYEAATVVRAEAVVWDWGWSFRFVPGADAGRPLAIGGGRIVGQSGGVPKVWDVADLTQWDIGLAAGQTALAINPARSVLVSSADGGLALLQNSVTLRPLPAPQPVHDPIMASLWSDDLTDDDVGYGQFADGGPGDVPVPVRWDCRG